MKNSSVVTVRAFAADLVRASGFAAPTAVRKLTLSSLCMIAVLHAGAARPEGHAHWAYTGHDGPAEWGAMDPAFASCQLGKTQSPIDIRDAKVADLPAIKFDYKPSPLKIIDNGHTIQVNYAAGSSIDVGGVRYELVQFHFHHPSEEEIDGKAHSMVAHLVHKNAEGKLAVVAVLLDGGGNSELLETLWKNIPQEKEKEKTVVQRQHRRIEAAAGKAGLLHVRRIVDHASMQRRRDLVRAEIAGQDRRHGNRKVRRDLSAECASGTAAQRPRHTGVEVKAEQVHFH